MNSRLQYYMESSPLVAVGGPRSDRKKVPVEFRKGINGLDTILLRGPGSSSAEVLLYGAQVISWKTMDGEELLFVSSKANFDPPKPDIPGGVSICSPDISIHESRAPPGIGKDRLWAVDCSSPTFQTTSVSEISVDLILPPNEADDMPSWAHMFECRLRITLGTLGELILTSRIKNICTDKTSFSFSFAYRNYLSVSNIREVRIEGLKKVKYQDKLKEMKQFTEEGNAVTFKSEVDKMFIDAHSKIAVIDRQKKRTIFIQKTGLPNVGVWNAWKEKAMGEIGENEYENTVCVEPCLLNRVITLEPREEWQVQQELIFDSAYE